MSGPVMLASKTSNDELRFRISETIKNSEPLHVTPITNNRFVTDLADLVITITVVRLRDDTSMVVEGITDNGQIVRLTIPPIGITTPARIGLGYL